MTGLSQQAQMSVHPAILGEFKTAADALPSTFEDASGKDIDDAFREVDELLERWENRLSVKNLPFAKRYSEDEFVVILVVVCRAGRGSLAKKYCAVFQRKLLVGRNERHGEGRAEFAKKIHRDRPLDLIVSPADGDEQAVLIDNIYFVETPKGTIRSTIRLQPLDESESSLGSSVEARSDVALGKLGGRAYWEFGVFSGRPAIVSDEVVGKKIKTRTEIVNNIANGAAPPSWNILHYQKLIKFLSGLQITMTEDDIRFTVLEGSYLGLQLVKMLLGPVDLYSAADEVICRHGKRLKRA